MKRFAILVALLSVPLTPIAAAAAPANDAYADAIPITSLPFTALGSNVGATSDGEADVCDFTGASVWYSYTVPVEQSLIVDLPGTDTGRLHVAVFSGDSVADARLLDCSTPSHVRIRAGTTIHIRVAGYSNMRGSDLLANKGTFRLSVAERPESYWDVAVPLPNDDLEDAMPMTSLPFYDVQMLGPATREPEEPAECAPDYRPVFGEDTTAWYHFDAQRDGALGVLQEMHFGAGFFGAFEIIDGRPAFISCAMERDDIGDQWYLRLPVQAGHSYAIQLIGAKSYGYNSASSLWVWQLPEANVAVTDVLVRDDPGIVTVHSREIIATLAFSGYPAGRTLWTVEVCPRTASTPCGIIATGELDFAPDDRGQRTLRVTWSPTGCAGDVDVRVRLDPASFHDLDPSDDARETLASVGPSGTGVGVVTPTCSLRNRF